MTSRQPKGEAWNPHWTADELFELILTLALGTGEPSRETRLKVIALLAKEGTLLSAPPTPVFMRDPFSEAEKGT